MNKNKYEVSKKYVHRIVRQYTCTTKIYVHKHFYHPYVQQYTCTSDSHVQLANFSDRFAILNELNELKSSAENELNELKSSAKNH